MDFKKKLFVKRTLLSASMLLILSLTIFAVIKNNLEQNTPITNAASGAVDITDTVSSGLVQAYNAKPCWSATCNQLQGFTIANDSLVFYTQPSGIDQGILNAYNGNDFASAISGTPKEVNYGHGNDMTYNSKTNKILVVGPNDYSTIYFLNQSTLAQESSSNISNTWGIGYDEFHDYYVLLQGKIKLTDTNFQTKAEFNYAIDGNVSQGLEYHNGYVYHTVDNWSESLGGEIAYIYTYKAKLKSDGSTEKGFGERVASYYINAVSLGEIESISFGNNRAYLGFANSTTGVTKFYSISDNTLEFPIETTIKYNDNVHSTTVTITGSDQLKAINGYTLSSDGYSLSKTVNSGSVSESVKVCDNYKNCKNLNISHTNNNYIEQQAQTVSFANSSVTRKYGDAAFTNKATTTGDGAITYASSNPSIATVDNNGKVTIKTAGKVTITATAAATDRYSEASASYILTVEKAPQTISFASASVTKTYGDAAFINDITISGDGSVTYSSSDTGVATIDANGKVTIKSAGYTRITATVSATTNYSSVSESYNLTVEKNTQKVTFANSSIAKTYGDAAFTNKATTTGDGAITYASTNKAIATVDDDGLVTINSAGTVTIIATAEGTNNYAQATADYQLTINKATQAITFEDTQEVITIDYGATDYANRAVSNATAATIDYYSSDDKIATVDQDGKITTKKSGTVTITAVASDENYEDTSKSYELNIQYILSFNMNGGTGKLEQQSCISEKDFTDCEIKIQSAIPSMNDLFFLGWSEDASSFDANYYAGEKISMTENKILYAVWTDGKVVWVQGNEHILGNDDDLIIEIDVPLGQFSHVAVDDVTIPEKDYDIKNGSTILTLHASYLNSLSEGSHSLAVYYDNDSAVLSSFIIKKKIVAPDTGKNTEIVNRNTAILSIIAPICLLLVGVRIMIKRRKSSHRRFEVK